MEFAYIIAKLYFYNTLKKGAKTAFDVWKRKYYPGINESQWYVIKNKANIFLKTKYPTLSHHTLRDIAFKYVNEINTKQNVLEQTKHKNRVLTCILKEYTMKHKDVKVFPFKGLKLKKMNKKIKGLPFQINIDKLWCYPTKSGLKEHFLSLLNTSKMYLNYLRQYHENYYFLCKRKNLFPSDVSSAGFGVPFLTRYAQVFVEL